MTVLIWFHTSQYRDFKAWRILKKSVGTGKREKERLMEYRTEDDLQLIETMTAGRPK